MPYVPTLALHASSPLPQEHCSPQAGGKTLSLRSSSVPGAVWALLKFKTHVSLFHPYPDVLLNVTLPVKPSSEPLCKIGPLPSGSPAPCHTPLTQLMFGLMIFKKVFFLIVVQHTKCIILTIKCPFGWYYVHSPNCAIHHLSSSRIFSLLPKQPHLH